MEYPKKLILAVLVENKQQEDAIFNSFIQNKSIENVGNVSAISRDDLFEERRILYNCFSESVINKLKDIAKLKDGSLEEMQSQISNIIDEFIEDLE
ncbi:hypothetical protein NM952_12250 [Pasteurella multocida subsp. multocida]|uniref:hypothetical protein n=1 Tax=Pasteurella multocida TaxID=747 RepID=UPI000869CCA7|nr:hypothetical protein [Pasteurella multocida]MBF6981657.1 hypothetical protein [Pasteurella multocida]MDA5609293.1 hypothetical protein [Pasteurella multocida subsp. multocida]MDA5616809.1 hypothetical protein [Pasteurella multocida]MDA5619357.1 hypothetical protein [Pasteurella multocida subsp. multocida]MDA5626821.1 hypothetical protein [Pasteurella multocida]